ncbi:MAG: heme-binding domain-containing protein, partial [Bryobacteraceae bacterium]
MIAICSARSTRILALALMGLALATFATTGKRPEKERPRNVAAPASIDPTLDPPPAIAALISRSCGDCHSSATRWPWYARIPPGSWMLQSEVTRARR